MQPRTKFSYSSLWIASVVDRWYAIRQIRGQFIVSVAPCTRGLGHLPLGHHIPTAVAPGFHRGATTVLLMRLRPHSSHTWHPSISCGKRMISLKQVHVDAVIRTCVSAESIRGLEQRRVPLSFRPRA